VLNRYQLNIPEMMFVVVTRAALAGGVGLLISEKLEKRTRRKIGWVLAGLGALTTLPAAILVRGNQDRSEAASA